MYGTEQRYTLDEARRELARQECQRDGHSWDVMSSDEGGPFLVRCGSCGWAGDVQMRKA